MRKPEIMDYYNNLDREDTVYHLTFQNGSLSLLKQET